MARKYFCDICMMQVPKSDVSKGMYATITAAAEFQA